jgi:hypothetical protein
LLYAPSVNYFLALIFSTMLARTICVKSDGSRLDHENEIFIKEVVTRAEYAVCAIAL